jgi:hypothetical protein
MSLMPAQSWRTAKAEILRSLGAAAPSAPGMASAVAEPIATSLTLPRSSPAAEEGEVFKVIVGPHS